MFSLSPFGGISLIAHIIINMIAICYRSIRGAFYFLFPNAIPRKHTALSKPRLIDRILASGIVLGMFALFLGSAMSILNMHVPMHPELNALKIVPRITNMQLAFGKNNAVATTSSTEMEMTDTVEDDSSLEKTEDSQDSITDVMKSAHVDSSFETRALIAAELMIVNEPSEYIGTAEQNKLLLEAFTKLFGPRLAFSTNVETTTISFIPKNSL